jgi:hypothetical protein
MGALHRLLSERMRMLREDALAVSQVVEDAFAGQSELDDENLDKDLRQVFYDLQDERILDVRRVERLDEGHQRRFYLWRIREEEVASGASQAAASEPAQRLYQRLEDQAWERKPAKV